MNYYEFSIPVADNTNFDEEIVAALLGEISFESFITDEGVFKAYIQEQLYEEKLLNEFIKKYNILNSKVGYIKQENWNAQWEAGFQPVVVDQSCIVRAGFHNIDKQYLYDIVVEPKMSFGTGHHETTFLMLKVLLENDLHAKSVVDCGCGTGILAILAAKKGAKSVFAFDVDEWACENTRENCKLNAVDNIDIKLGGVEVLKNRKFDVVLANINKNTLLSSISYLSKAIEKNGVIFMSGFYNFDIDDIAKVAQNNGLKYISHSENNDWVAAKFMLD